MAFKIDDATIDYAHCERLKGRSWPDISRDIGCDSEGLRKRCVAKHGGGRIYLKAYNAKPFPEDECLDLQRNGASVKSLAERYGTTRASIRAFLVRQGVQVRSRSAANVARFAAASEEQRKAITKSANATVRGGTQSREHAIARAESRSRRIGAGEVEMAEQLQRLGFQVQPQFPIDVYNVDLLVNGRIVVELRCDAGLPTKSEHQRKRLEYIRDLGFPVLYLCFREWRAVEACFQYVLADLQTLGRLPTGRGQYRMVWCALQRFARVRDDKGRLTSVPTPESPIYRTRESDL